MRIGLFTDTYQPSINGIVYVVDITRRRLEELGHEVYIFCPADTVLRYKDDDDHIIRFPGVKGAFFDDYNLSLFFPPRLVRRIRDLDLDVIHFFTPGQIGLMGIYAANKLDIKLVAQHSTDLAQYIRLYPAVVPGLLLLGLTLPLTFRFDGKDVKELLKIYRPKKAGEWGQAIVESLMAMVYSRCDAVIALSEKSVKQLKAIQQEYQFAVELMPTGVDALPVTSVSERAKWRTQHGIASDDKIVLYVGRIAPEKNLALLVEATERLVSAEPQVRLVYVGGGEFEKELHMLAEKSSAHAHITFTGPMPRNELNKAYQSAEVFVFPSLTDTQGLVLHEAALAGCPIVLCDPSVSEVAVQGDNAYAAEPTATSVAEAVGCIIHDEQERARCSAASLKLAHQFTETKQTKKLSDFYERL